MQKLRLRISARRRTRDDDALLFFHVGALFRRVGSGSPTLDASSYGHVGIDAHTRVAFSLEPAGNAYVGVGSAARGDTHAREDLRACRTGHWRAVTRLARAGRRPPTALPIPLPAGWVPGMGYHPARFWAWRY